MGTCRVVGMGSKLIGCGSATPSLSVSNDDLSKIVETSDEWIAARTGIRNRRVLSGTSSSPYSIEFHDKLVSLASVVPPLCGCIINICGTSS
jgi:3-oxoacyl-[acyl-carrier-protein] synthase-3